MFDKGEINGSTPSQMDQVLKKSCIPSTNLFLTKGSAERPMFYETGHAIIFPPSSDERGPQYESIQETLTQAALYLRDCTDNPRRIMLFPVLEVRPFFSIIGSPRNHWVTLHFDPNTETATVIDSRPWLTSYFYKTKPITDLLRQGLLDGGYPFTVATILDPEYQGVQDNDFIFCGAWTAINIEAYAHGATIESHRGKLTPNDIDGILQHNYNLVNRRKNGVYDRETIVIDSVKPSTPASTNSTGELSSEPEEGFNEDEDDDDFLPWDGVDDSNQSDQSFTVSTDTSSRALSGISETTQEIPPNGPLPYPPLPGHGERGIRDSRHPMFAVHGWPTRDDVRDEQLSFTYPNSTGSVDQWIAYHSDHSLVNLHHVMPVILSQRSFYATIQYHDEHARQCLYLDSTQMPKMNLDSFRQSMNYLKSKRQYGPITIELYPTKSTASNLTDDSTDDMNRTLNGVRTRAITSSAFIPAITNGSRNNEMNITVQNSSPLSIISSSDQVEVVDSSNSLANPNTTEANVSNKPLQSVIHAGAPSIDQSTKPDATFDHDKKPDANFQLRCIQGLFVFGIILVAAVILTCPPVAAALGIGSGLATTLLITSGAASATSFLSSGGLFAYRLSKPSIAPSALLELK
ncbi:MAG: hypothetical protein Q8R24_08815 [Legionellaceae bacterium]|nr:hypothetical protein [Legionellaceae bacterium]